MTSASGRVRLFGTFVAPSAKCAATGCPCCRLARLPEMVAKECKEAASEDAPEVS